MTPPQRPPVMADDAPIAPENWPRLLDLVAQALDQPADARPAWVQGLGLPEALARALRGLLDERRALETRGFLQGLPTLPPPGPGLAAGGQIGPWRLVRLLGQGGMSVVWLAERADGQEARQVALKLPHAGPGQAALAQRLLRERRILAGLAHPHIARLYDVGLTEAGTPYLVMEHVAGEPLLDHADARRLGLPARVALFQQVLAAVQHAHGLLVLHRDIKPANLMVDGSGQARLLDFGIATLMAGDGSGAEPSALTQVGGRPLTPSHASPEQLRGQPLGTASDVYALGGVLCELLSGQRPFAGLAATPAQREQAILDGDPPLPSQATLTPEAAAARGLASAAALARALRGDLDAIVLKALAREPAGRYPSAEAFAADLARWLRGQPVQARAPGWGYRAGKFLQRHRWPVALGSAAMGAVLAAGSAALVQAHSARQQGERAAMARDYLLQLFEAAAPDRHRGADLSAVQMLEQGRQKAEAELGAQPRLQAELLAGIGETQYQVGDMVGAEAALGQAATLFQALGDRPKQAAVQLARLQVALDEENQTAAALQDGLLASLATLSTVIAQDPGASVKWLRLRGRHAAGQGKRADAQAWLTEAVARADLAEPAQAAVAFQARVDLAIVAANQGDLAGARQQLQAARALADRPSTTPAPVRTWHLALAQVTVDEWADNIAAVLRGLPSVIAWCERELGPKSMRCSHLKLRHVHALVGAGAAAEARSTVQELLPWLRQQRSPLARRRAALTLARALAMDGQTDEHLEPMAVLRELVGTAALSPQGQMPALITLAEIRLRAGDHAGGQAWLAQARAALPHAGAEQTRAARHLRMGHGLALQSLGQDRAALTEMGPHCTEPAADIDNLLMQLNCVRSLAATGQRDRAAALTNHALPVLTQGLGAEAPVTRQVQQLLEALQAPGPYQVPPWHPSQIFYAF